MNEDCLVAAAGSLGRGWRPTLGFVDPLPQVLPRLEVRYVLAGQSNGLPGLGVAPLARRAKVQAEAPEPADLDALTLRQCVAHDLEDLLDGQLDILRRQMTLLCGDELYELGLRHAAFAVHANLPSASLFFGQARGGSLPPRARHRSHNSTDRRSAPSGDPRGWCRSWSRSGSSASPPPPHALPSP